MKEFYPIGTRGEKWGEAEKAQWLAQCRVKRSYSEEVVSQVLNLSSHFVAAQYGEIHYGERSYSLYAIQSNHWNIKKPTVLITGGVHGYETSGVHGALLFLQTKASEYFQHFNFLVVPCVSPWGYEVINRWNALAVDPNRSFYPNSPSPEAANLMSMLKPYQDSILVHFDLHETTDSDESEFRPALAARDGTEYIAGSIPDGFYTVGDSDNPQAEFQKAVIGAVSKVTHIAPPDSEGNIIGSPQVQKGVINYPMKKLGLCGGVTDCRFMTTTEVYPDSPRVTKEECNLAQVSAITGGLDYVVEWLSNH